MEINLFIMEKKRKGEMTFAISKSDKKRKRIAIFPWMSLLFQHLDSK